MTTDLGGKLKALFPASFTVRPGMTMHDPSPLLREWVGEIEGAMLTEVVNFQLPQEIETFQHIRAYENQIVLAAFTGQTLAVKGQFVWLEGSDCVLFIGVPWLSWIKSRHPATEINADMFPAFDSQLDQEFLISTQTAMIKDTEHLSREMVRRRRDSFVESLGHAAILNVIADELGRVLNEAEKSFSRSMAEDDVPRSETVGIRGYLDRLRSFSEVSVEHVSTDHPVDVRTLLRVLQTKFNGGTLNGGVLRASVSPEVPDSPDANSSKLEQILAIMCGHIASHNDHVSLHASSSPAEATEYPEYITFDIADAYTLSSLGKGQTHFDTFEDESQTSGLHPQLAACMSLINSLGGTVSLAAGSEQGSTVSVKVPFSPAPNKSTGGFDQSADESTGPLSSRALVISQSAQGMAAAETLANAGADVKVAESAEEGLYFASGLRFPVIVLDLTLPFSELQDFSNHFTRAGSGTTFAAIGYDRLGFAGLQDIGIDFDVILDTGDISSLVASLEPLLNAHPDKGTGLSQAVGT